MGRQRRQFCRTRIAATARHAGCVGHLFGSIKQWMPRRLECVRGGFGLTDLAYNMRRSIDLG